MKKLMVTAALAAMVCLIAPAGAVQPEPDPYWRPLFEHAMGAGDFQQGVDALVKAGVPVPVIISNLRRMGYADDRIVSGLLAAGLDRDTVTRHALEANIAGSEVARASSAGSPATADVLADLVAAGAPEEEIRQAARSLLGAGVEPTAIFTALVGAGASPELLSAVTGTMLDAGIQPYEALLALGRGGANSAVILLVSRLNDIPQAVVARVIRELGGDPGQYGYAYTRLSFPGPGLISIGLERRVGEREPEEEIISPATP